MRLPAPTPTGTPLPLPGARPAHRRHATGDLCLAPHAVAEFNRFLHELHPDAPHVDDDAIASVARWLQSQPPEQRDLLLQMRLARLEDLRSMRHDPDWPLDASQALRIDRLLAYVAGSNDLFADDTPAIGRLDDALLVELVWPMLAEELEDYGDFCRFRADLSGQGRRGLSQPEWLAARLQEGALWEQLHRVHESYYVDYSPPDRRFRVGG